MSPNSEPPTQVKCLPCENLGGLDLSGHLWSFYLNQVINQETDNQYVRITLKIPGLKVKRQLNLSKEPKNGRLVDVEYKKK